jgi:hypothetical protein
MAHEYKLTIKIQDADEDDALSGKLGNEDWERLEVA